MSSPMKPWEGAGTSSRVATPPCCSTTTPAYGNRPNTLRGVTASETGQNSAVKPPPVPRRDQGSSYGTLGGYGGGMMGSYGKRVKISCVF